VNFEPNFGALTRIEVSRPGSEAKFCTLTQETGGSITGIAFQSKNSNDPD